MMRILHVALEAASEKLATLQGGGEVERQGAAFGDAKSDTEIKADRVLGETIRDVILKSGDAKRLTIEGLGEFEGSGTRWYAVDPLDGSLDYKVRVPFWGGLPYTACITALSKAEDAKFSDIMCVAVADLRSAPGLHLLGAEWSEDRLENEYIQLHCHPGGQKFKTREDTKLDLGSQIVIGEMYYPENRELMARMFAGKKGWLRNPGSAAYEMTLVATGQAVAYICDRQKQHELGAGYLLVKGAGGVAVDFDGKDLGERVYDFKTQLPVILAGNQAIADELLELLQKAK